MRVLASTVIAVSLLLGPGLLVDASADPRRAAEEPGQAAGDAARRAGQRIDTSDKAEVRKAWETRMKAYLDTESGWIGSIDLCLAGTISAEARTGTLESINFVRGMAGLGAVSLGSALDEKSQAAALMMDANDALSHYPPSSWDCWTKAGADAASHGNLALTSGTMTAGRAVELFMDDRGRANKPVGHRRWLLRPEATRFGVGMTDTAHVVYVIGPTGKRRNPRWVTWPTAGWFPAALEPHGRWSISAGRSSARFDKARVVVRRVHGARLGVRVYKPAYGYAKPTLVFKVKGLEKTGKYRVTVRGIRRAGKARHTWTVKLFD